MSEILNIFRDQQRLISRTRTDVGYQLTKFLNESQFLMVHYWWARTRAVVWKMGKRWRCDYNVLFRNQIENEFPLFSGTVMQVVLASLFSVARIDTLLHFLSTLSTRKSLHNWDMFLFVCQIMWTLPSLFAWKVFRYESFFVCYWWCSCLERTTRTYVLDVEEQKWAKLVIAGWPNATVAHGGSWRYWLLATVNIIPKISCATFTNWRS